MVICWLFSRLPAPKSSHGIIRMAKDLTSAHASLRSSAVPAAKRPRLDLFLISLLILFLELACIRWFPAHVVFLTFFTNVVLLASFLGMSVGCLAAGHKRNYVTSTPLLLAIGLTLALLVEAFIQGGVNAFIDVGSQSSPDVVFFGTEYGVDNLDNISIPMEVICGLFFLIVALAFVGPGQVLGRAMMRVPDRVLAYTINISGSLLGILLFAGLSWLQTAPLAWFLPVAGLLGYFLWHQAADSPSRLQTNLACVSLFVVLGATLLHSNWISPAGGTAVEFRWSPYYRIDYYPPARAIAVNLIGHQSMLDKDAPTPQYALPHLLQRDVLARLGKSPQPFENVLIIGAGSGNDVSRALEWGAKHVDAVEIDPIIQALGARDHPLQPYHDPRVTLHLGDGRNFLRSTERKYDLIVYALVDSLVLHSSYSNIRLESYLFTKQAYQDIQRCLKPNGLFVTYNFFRQGWIVARLVRTLDEVFGQDNGLVFTFPYRPEVASDEAVSGFSTVFGGPGAEMLREAFQPPGIEYWLPKAAPTLATANGFDSFTRKLDKLAGASETNWRSEIDLWWRFAPATVIDPSSPLAQTSDDWPFLYVRQPMLPMRPVVSGMVVMAAIGMTLLFFVLRDARTSGASGQEFAWSFAVPMFFLGAGFMLIETKAVVNMALLFGSTWVVNSVVFFAVLVMILLANLFVLRMRPEKLWPYYVGLFVTLALNAVVPLEVFLGWPSGLQVGASCLLVFAPIGLAGVVFATMFRKTAQPDMALGANIAGAMLGGLAENLSMLIGFQYLSLVALGFYALSLPSYKWQFR